MIAEGGKARAYTQWACPDKFVRKDIKMIRSKMHRFDGVSVHMPASMATLLASFHSSVQATCVNVGALTLARPGCNPWHMTMSRKICARLQDRPAVLAVRAM